MKPGARSIADFIVEEYQGSILRNTLYRVYLFPLSTSICSQSHLTFAETCMNAFIYLLALSGRLGQRS